MTNIAKRRSPTLVVTSHFSGKKIASRFTTHPLFKGSIQKQKHLSTSQKFNIVPEKRWLEDNPFLRFGAARSLKGKVRTETILTSTIFWLETHQLWKSHKSFPKYRPCMLKPTKHQLLAGAIRMSKPQVFRTYFLDVLRGVEGEIFYDFLPWDLSTILHQHHVGVHIFCDCLRPFCLSHHGRNRKYWRFHPFFNHDW